MTVKRCTNCYKYRKFIPEQTTRKPFLKLAEYVKTAATVQGQSFPPASSFCNSTSAIFR